MQQNSEFGGLRKHLVHLLKQLCTGKQEALPVAREVFCWTNQKMLASQQRKLLYTSRLFFLFLSHFHTKHKDSSRKKLFINHQLLIIVSIFCLYLHIYKEMALKSRLFPWLVLKSMMLWKSSFHSGNYWWSTWNVSSTVTGKCNPAATEKNGSFLSNAKSSTLWKLWIRS